MIILGLTGGIASGKSTVSAELSRRGLVILDMDRIAREVVEVGQPGLGAIVEAFGVDMLTPQGTLDRPKLGRLIFARPEARHRLDALLEPFITETLEAKLAWCREQDFPLVVLDAALLFEAGLDARCHKVIVVDCSEEQQIARMAARNNLNREEALARIRSQMPRKDRRAKATWIVDNCWSRDELDADIENLWHSFIRPLLG